MTEALRGLVRSLRIYRGRRHLRSLTRFCAELAPGAALVFDVGAHAGDRVTAFRRLGARVVAIEPQPVMAGALRALFALDRGVIVEQAAAGAAPGRAVMLVNRANPTVTTLSEDFVRGADGAAGWDGQAWDSRAETELVTLDALSERHGRPDFVKIDAEGYEAEVLKGLSLAPKGLSFEVTTVARAAGLAALKETERLGFRRYRLSLGESHEWATGWLDAAEMASLIREMPHETNSGDIAAAR